MRLVPPAALLAALLFLSVGSAQAAPLILFHTPSNNIGCAMSDSKALGAGVRCDIGEHSWPLPPRPKTYACTQVDYVAGLALGSKGKSGFFCAGDTVMHQGRVLKYGRHLNDGRFTCWSRRTGVTCRNRRNGHGLFLSRASYRRF